MSPDSIAIHSAGAELSARSGTGATGFLFECAPDSSAYALHPAAVPLSRLIGDFEDTKARAHKLATNLLADEPPMRGIGQLGIFEELIIRELQRALHLLHLHRTLVGQGIKHCHFEGHSPFAGELAWLAAHMGSGLTVTGGSAVGPHLHLARFKRVWQRLRSAGFSKAAASREWRQVLERLDPYHRRERRVAAPAPSGTGQVWFYTTAHTFTQIGLYYEPYFPQPFTYLVENPQAGGELLRRANRPSMSIYAFGTRSSEPSAKELGTARQQVLAHVNRLALSREEDAARQSLLRSSFFQTFLDRHLPSGLYASSLFANWAKTALPAALVVGNPVFEGYALHAAQSLSIPTVLLQHGILGDFCQFSDPPVDHYVVRGTFWRDFLAQSPRSRSHVLEPAHSAADVTRAPSPGHAILLVTAPYGLQPFFHLADLDDILRTVLAAAAASRCELIVRVHPLEDVGFYRSRIETLSRGATDRVTYSQGAGLDAALQRTAVAVTFSSTVFLECLRLRIPIVSFGWHHFSYKQQIECHGVFHFADDLASLSTLVRAGAAGELAPYVRDTEPFLANTAAASLREELAKLVEPRVALPESAQT